MNRLCYRVIFNKSLRRLVVVSEKTGSQSKSDNPSVGGSILFTTSLFGLGLGSVLKVLSLSLLLSLGLAAHANTPTTIIADSSTPKNLQPIILNTASGIVSVNIQTPNANGLSNNHYRQFDVGNTGAVLNNNRKAVNTQIAGFVQANPFMARGEATTILNQINSNHPSHLGGFIEIAGKKADVIIANPSGLVVNGAGFINAGNVHLAAANSTVNQGQLSGYQVSGNHAAKIEVNGKLNLQSTDYAALIAKTAQINDEIYAGNILDVITGENQVNLQNNDFTKLNATNKQANVSSASQTTNNKEQQGVALDVATLGGMYAGKIHLVGTDKGFGVNNQGVVLATGTGSNGGLTLDAQGNLVNTGVMSAKDKLTVNTHNNAVQNDGTITSQQKDIQINSNHLDNTGLIQSTQTATINATSTLNNTGDIRAGVLQVQTGSLSNTKKLIQTGTGNLNINTNTLDNTDKAVIGKNLYEQTKLDAPATPSTDQSTGGVTTSLDLANTESANNTNNNTKPNNEPNPPTANGFIIANHSLTNAGDQALITATGDIGISADKTSNTKQASIDVQSLNTNTLVNTDSKIALDEINWQLSRFDNNKGELTTKHNMAITSQSDLTNTQGRLASGGDMVLSTAGKLINHQGQIHSNRDLTVKAKQLDNSGQIDSTTNAVLHIAQNLTNTQTGNISAQAIDIRTKDLQNMAVITAKELSIEQTDDYTHNKQGKLLADTLKLTVQGDIHNQSSLTASKTLIVHANHIDNDQEAVIGGNQHTQIISQTDLKNQGLINGEQTLIKAANTIDNLAGGRIYGTHLAIQADTLNNTPAKLASTQDTSQASQAGNQHTTPVIAARDRLDIGVNHLNNQPNPDRVGKFNENFDNQARIISLGSLHIAGSLDDNQYATGKAKTVINRGATIESVGQMSIASQTVQNSNANYQKQNIKLDEQTKPNQVFYRPKSTTHEYPESQVVLGSTSRGLGDAVLYIKDEKGNLINQGEDWHRIQKTLNTFEDRTTASDPARMVAGGHILFDVNHLTNDKSQMNAGAGSQIIGHNLSNDKDDTLVGRQIQHSTNITSQFHTVGWNRTRTRHRHNWGGVVAQADESKVLASYPLPILKASTGHQTGQENKPSATLSGIPSTLTVPPVDIKATGISSANTATPIHLPTSSLYLISGDNPNQPLLMTDPAFIDAKNWLSSDYMLKALQSDPSHIHKRLADGYGEQQQLSDQYQRLTGRHILGDYQNNEIAFKTLMDNGIAHAKAFHYTLGIALTPAQMANLTTDIVWLVKQTVSYESKDKDGNTITKTEEVLVPTLYQKTGNTKTGTLTKDGRYSGITGKSIDLQLTGNLDNNGNLIAQNTTNIKADHVNNNGIIQGDFVHITADQDINNQHTIYADSAASLNAGNNITNQSQTITHQHQKGQSSSSDTQISQIASIQVGSGLKDKTDDNGKPLTTLTIKAGNHILYKAANTQNAGGSTQLVAHNGIHLDSITQTNQINAIGDDNNYFKHSQSTDVGSSIVSHGNLTLATTADQAGITATAANLQSGGTTAIVATGDVRFEAGRHIDTHEDSNKLSNNSLVKKQTEQNLYKAYSNTSIQNQIGGENVLMKSGGNMTLVATDVLADKDIVLNSAGSMTIASAANTQSTHEYSQIDKKGLFSTAPTSVTLGKQRTQSESGSSQTTYTGSLIGTTGGNITMMSGDSLNIINSDIIAQKDQNSSAGNIYLQATDATITSQNKTSDTEHRFAQKTTGITASVSSSLVGDVQSIETLKDATQDTNSRRAKLMGGLAAASKAHTLAQNLKNGNLGSIRVQATAGSQSTKNQTLVHQEENDAANIHADNNLIINLKGKGKNSDLVVTGSNISVGNNLYQNVEGDVIYQASTQTDTTDSQNSSKGWGAGIYASTQIGGGNASQGFTVNANKAKGNSTETTITHTNTQVTVKGSTINNIGGNLTLDGANLDTKHLTGTVGGDLIVKSRQDSYQYTHDQKQAGFSADVGFNGKPQSININGGKTDIDASYKQVTHQSGIKANQSTLQVQGQGNFTGGYLITDAGKNQTQFAQGITTESLENHLSYQGDAISVGIGIGTDTSSPNGKAKPALQGLGYGKIDPVNKTSTTHSAITDQAGLSHINTENFNQAEVQSELNEIIDNSFNQEQALKELNAQVNITTEFGREAPKQIGDYAQNKELELLAQGNIEEAKKWAEGGIYRVALHTAVGAIGTGTIEGAVTTGGIAASAPIIDKLSKQITKQLIKAGISENAAQNATSLITSLAIATATQSAGVDTSSTVMAVNADAFNRQLHPTEFYVIQIIAEKLGVDEEELKKAILYHIDKGWQDNITEKEAEKVAAYQDLYKQALGELNGRSINGYLDDLYNMQEVDPELSNVTGQQSSENETYDTFKTTTVTLEPSIIVIDRDFEADKTNLYLKQEGMAFKATNDDFKNGRIFAARSFNEIQYNFPSLVKDMSVFEKLQETSDGFVAFSEGIVEGGVSSIKDLADAIMNLPNVDISAFRERAYKLSSDTIKYLTDSQYRDSINQEAVYDLKTDIAYGQILALQGDADKIGQVVGEATGRLVSDLAVSVGTAGVGKGLGQVVKIVGNKSSDGTPNTPTPNNTHAGTLLASTECSFHGSMQVKTLFGYKPISSIRINDWVFAKNEITGKTNYRQVLQTINSIDPDTTRITIVNSDGVKQTIISDGLHPYFVDFTGDTTPPKPSTGHRYKGNLTHAYWVGAKDIEIGHRLIDDKGNYQTVISIHTEQTPLNSYNLEVDTDHTFFIKGIDGVESVWVHNKNCFTAIGGNPTTEVIDGKTVTYSDYVIGMDSNKQSITKRIPTISEDGKIVEVKVESGKVSIVNENKPNVNYKQTDGKLVSRVEETGTFATNEHKPPQPVVERIIPDNLETNKAKKLFNSITLHESLPDPVAGWDYKPHLLEKGNNGTDANIYSHVNGYLGEIELANRVVNEGYIVLKWGDKIGRNGSDIISIDPKTNTVVLWDNKYRSGTNEKLDLSPTFDNEALTEKGNLSGAWDGAKDEAIKAIGANTDPRIQAIRDKLVADLRQGNVETRTVGSGALQGQEIVQKYRNDKKVNDGNTTNNNTDSNTKEISKCDPLKMTLCSK